MSLCKSSWFSGDPEKMGSAEARRGLLALKTGKDEMVEKGVPTCLLKGSEISEPSRPW